MGKRKLPLTVDDVETEPDEQSGTKSKKEADSDEFISFLSSSLSSDKIETITSRSQRGARFNLEGMPTGMHAGGVTPMTFSHEAASDQQWVEKLVTNFNEALDGYAEQEATSLRSLASLMAKYVDISLTTTSKSNHRTAYCAHALNHVIRTRNLVIANKRRLEAATEKGTVNEALIESMRDQGFVRPTVLILSAYRKNAFKIVEAIKQLMFGNDNPRAEVVNKARFEKEFKETKFSLPKRLKAEDEEDGNQDDCFRLGIALSRKSLKLYSPFDISDILLCSPLGLRMILGGDKGSESHLLSSIQLLVIDDADVLLQQNWEHVSLIADTLHGTPSKINSDVSRVRTLYLEGHASLYCQTLLFCSHRHELFTAFMSKRQNHRGAVTFKPPSDGFLTEIEIPICSEMHRIHVEEAADQSDIRMAYFREKVVPTLEDQTAIFIPSYFDFVRIRNQFKKDMESFVQCQEYAPPNKITRARDMFYRGDKKLMLITERFHYYNRFRLRGIKRLVFYQPPSCPSFYPEVINMCQPTGRLLCTLLFTKFDRIRMENVFGFDMGNTIMKSEKQILAILSE